LHLSQTWPALLEGGPSSLQARDAFAATDAELRRLVGCVESSAAGRAAAIFVVGDSGVVDVHSVLEPNVALAEAGLLIPNPAVPSLATRWSAFVRPSGGAGFVYARKEEDAVLARFEAPGDILRHTIVKGPITIDGVSLTVIAKDERSFTVSLVQFTQQHTNLVQKQPGDSVNLESDIIARYVDQLLAERAT